MAGFYLIAILQNKLTQLTMEANQIIILSAVLFFIFGFVVYFIGIIRIGRKNAQKNKFRVYCPLNHGDIFKYETKLNAKLHTLLSQSINDNTEIEGVEITVFTKQPTNKF